jgi:hypothetical protein
MTAPGYEEERKTLQIPAAVGKAGYLRVISALLDLLRVQQIVIAPGKVEYFRLRASDEPENPTDVELETLMPYSIIRNHPLDELIVAAPSNAAVAVGQLLTAVTLAGLRPAAFVTGPDTLLYRWYYSTTAQKLPKGSVFGVPLLVDPGIGGEALVVCAAYGPNAMLIDTVRSFKITMWGT